MEWITSLGEWLLANPSWSALAYVVAFAVIMGIGVPGGNALMLTGGFLFGWLAGAVLTTIGGILAALLTHALIRTALGGWLDQRAARFRSAVRSFVHQGNSLLLVLPRLVPVFPFFALNVGFTAAGIPLRTYLWTMAAGLLPIAMLICGVGAQFRGLTEIDRESVTALLSSPGLYGPLLILIGLTIAGWVLVRRRRPA